MLNNDMENMHKWFVCHSVETNLHKFQFIILGNTGSHKLQINDIFKKSTSSSSFLDITIDSNLKLKQHI